ncbi:MAG: hypothetical protein AB1758_33220 [Candidatus Eremiobacterota bacterium]
MQNAIAFRPAFTALNAAASQAWKNGVVHSDGETDVYEIPSATPGVAARVELKPILWGLLGKEVIATDNQGNRLEGHREWEGFHRVVVTRDPKSGLETVLDPREQTVSVSTPHSSELVENHFGWFRERYQQEARQELDSEGNCCYIANLRGERETAIAYGPPGMGVPAAVVTEDNRSWDQVNIARGQAPVAHRMEATRDGEKQGAALTASIAADGKLGVVGEDGTARNYEMFLKV